MLNTTSGDLVLQKAVYDALAGNVPLGEGIVPVFDTVTPDSPLPYIVIGDTSAVPNNTKDNVGEYLTTTIHVWSDKKGFKEVKEIRNEVERLLTQGKATLEGGKKISNAVVVYKDAFTDSDGMKKHGILRLEYWVYDNP